MMELFTEKTDTNEVKITEQYYEEFYSKADILYFSVDSKGKIVSCNVTLCESLNYEKKELLGKNFLVLYPEKDKNDIENVLKVCLSRGYLKDKVVSFMDCQGHLLQIKLNGIVIQDETHNVIGVRFFGHDISEKIRSEKQNHLSLYILKYIQHGIFESSLKEILGEVQKMMESNGIGITLQRADGEDFILGNWNDITNKSNWDAVDFRRLPPETWKRLIKIWSRTKAGHATSMGSFWSGSLSDLMLEIQSGDEKEMLVSMSDYESLAVIPIGRDDGIHGYFILPHYNSEKWDERDIDLLEKVISNVSVEEDHKKPVTFQFDEKSLNFLNIPMIGMLICKEGIIQYTNQWVQSLLGWTNDQIQGKSYLDLFDSEYHESIKILSNQDGLSEENLECCDVVVIGKDDEKSLIECSVVKFPMSGQIVDLWYWISKENQERLHIKLIQARKMESLGMLVGGVVHDFNNLLSTILGYSSMLREEISKDSGFYDDVRQLAQTAEKATQLTSRLLAYTKGKSYMVSDLQVNVLIREVAAILSSTMDKKIVIRAELDDNLACIQGDANQIQLTILHVALNARDAMPNGGKLLFQTKNISLNDNDARLRFGGQPGKYVQIIISDTGIGMSSRLKGKIFEPYFTTKQKGAGKGLGLSMVREIVEKSGGFISVFSEKDKGTVFKLHFSVAKKGVMLQKGPASEKPALGKETILLVDDEKVLRDTARRMLTRYGYKVISVGNGTEAIAIFKKYRSRIDLIMMDLLMPGMDIHKILIGLKKLNPKVKIIATSNVGEKEIIKRGIHDNLSGYVEKPFQVRPLLEKIRSILNA